MLTPNNEKRDFIIKELKSHNFKVIPYLISNSFLTKLYSDSYENWFDIEQAYYQELKQLFLEEDTIGLKSLNKNLSEIRESFRDYLKGEIQTSEDKDVYYSFTQHFENRENVTFINFNYTDTIKHYARLINDSDLNIKRYLNIQIHGKLDENIIFGYGDDADEAYNEMKNSRVNEYLRNFKTFEYLKSSNYRKVVNELTIFDQYDCLVIGHSLDTTDKTILKTILDNSKCINIELLKRSDLTDYYEQKEAHFNLHANLSRIFSEEADLRAKLIPFEWSVHFPKLLSNDGHILIKRGKELYKEPEKSGVVVRKKK